MYDNGGGFICLYRKIREWGWYTDKNTKILFLELLLTANFKDGYFMGEVIHRGTVVTSINKLSLNSGLTERETRTALSHLKKTGEITVRATSKYSIITLNNYEKYQNGKAGL